MNFSREFTRVEYLFLISFVLIYLFYFYRVFSAARKLKTTATSSVFKFLVRSIYLGLMSMAMLGPNFGVTETEARASGKDIFIAFDLSESMNANDVEPSRIDKSKSEMLGLADRFNADRIGVMVFNSEAYVLTPLTFDEENIRNSVRTLRTSLLGRGSTDFNPVLALLNEKLGTGSQNRGKVGVIITDGEAHYPLRQQEAGLLKKNNIRLFFVGVGTLGGGKIPVMQGYKKDKEGEDIVTSLEVDKISALAKATGGEYFILNNIQNDLPALADRIALVAGSADDLNRQSVTYNKYIFFLLLAMIFVGVDFLITVKVLKI
ncbi:MAG: VWA domain-containing protein [Leadbetterella sp.]|nr:VWA domain-containing protein [Leadbetterella sp.]